MSSEARVGAIFVLVVVVAAATGMYLGGYWQRLGTYYIYLRVADAGTVQSGADIMLSGVKIGTVGAVKLDPSPSKWPGRPVVMALALKRGAVVPDGYIFSIAQGGLLSNRYISVDPPPPGGAKSGGLVKPGSEIAGGGMHGLAALDTLAEQMKQALPDAANNLTARLNRLADRAESTYLSEENEVAIRRILQNVTMMTGSANRAALQAVRLTQLLSATAARSAPATAEMIKSLAAAATNVRAVAERVNKMLTFTSLPGDMNAAGQHIRSATESMDDTAAAIRKLVASPETQERLNQLTDNLARSSANLARLTEQAEKLLGDETLQADFKASIHDLRSTSGDLSATMSHLRQVLTDPGLSDDLRATVHNARTVSDQGTQIAEKANHSLDRVDRTMDRLGGAVSSLKPSGIRSRIDLYGVRNNGLQADLDMDFFYGPRQDQFWRLGIVDFASHDRLDLQRGFIRAPWTLRAGVFASKPGVGVDWAPTGGSWRMETEVYDPNQLTLDWGLFHSLGSDWYLTLGVKDAFRETEPFLGLRRDFPLSGSSEGGKTK